MKLLIDNGNSKLKIALVEKNAIKHIIVTTIDEIGSISISNVEEILLTNTNQNFTNQTIVDLIRNKFNVQPKIITPEASWNQLKNGYHNPNKLGIDRWLGLVFAWDTYEDAFNIISCGSFITYDEVDKTGKHLGGLIIPGLNFSKDKSLTYFAKSPRLDRELQTLSLASTTNDAINFGCNHSFVATIKHLTSLNPKAKTLITGGNAEFAKLAINSSLELQTNLPLKGLLIIANSTDR